MVYINLCIFSGRKKGKDMYEIEWIPVTDRYPDSSRRVLVTCKYDDQYEIEIGEFWDLTPSMKKKIPEEYGFGLLHKNAIAWAELPKPYIIEKEQ